MLAAVGLRVLVALVSATVGAAQNTVHSVYVPNEETSRREMCACQRDDGYLQNATCFEELRAVCEAEGAYSAMIPHCRVNWSDPQGIYYNPVSFMAIMRASAVKCRHPFTFSVTDMSSFLGAIATAPFFYAASSFGPKFFAHSINGAIMTELTMDLLINQLGLSVGDAVTFDEVKRIFLTPVPPINVGGQQGRDVPVVDFTFNVKSVRQIEEVKFEFDATFDVVMRWSDANMWAECFGNGAAIDEGQCRYVWKPRLTFPNGKDVDIPLNRQYLWTNLGAKTVTYQLEISGTFSSPMSFVKFPMDQHELPITVALIDAYGDLTRKQLRWDPVSAKLDAHITATEDNKDTISGWNIISAQAREHPFVAVDMVGMKTAAVSAVTCEVTVRRTTFFFMINYIMVIILLTSLSWITFIMDPLDLSDRCGIPLTLLLALNVFQLILSELMPKTGYLTPMHEFVIISTFFTVFAAVESMASNLLHRRAMRSAKAENPYGVGDIAVIISKFARLERLLTAYIDRAALVAFPISYGAYIAWIFG